MFGGLGRPLLASGSSGASSAQLVASKISRQIRLASVQKSFSNNGPTRKQKEKPKRDKVPGAFLPLPPSQVEAFGGSAGESVLKSLPQPQKGAYSSKLVGSALRFPDGQEILTKHYGLPRNIFVDFRLLSEPCAVSRKVTHSLAARLDAAGKKSSQSERLVLTGTRGCGKSYTLLQAVNHCYLNDWIVFYIPRAHKLVDSSTSYFYDLNSQTYLQPTASFQMLKSTWAVNKKILEPMKVTSEVIFDKRKPIPVGEPLKALFDVASTEQHLSPRILAALFEELGKQDKYPCLLAIDELQSLYCKTEYRNQHYEHIKSYHLSLPRLLMEYASGKRTFTRGAVIGALAPSLSHFPVPLELNQALGLGEPAHPYAKLLPGMVEYAKGLEAMPVPESLDYSEAASLFEMWVHDRALHTKATDELFLSKFSESSGNARSFVHGGLLSTQTS